MDNTLEKYLESVDEHLKPLPVSERIDIVKEIKSSMLEMAQDNMTAGQILERLAPPKEMAKAYLGDLLSKGKGINRNKYLTALAFYSLTGFTGLMVIPTLGILAPMLLLLGIVTPILGIIKLAGHLLNFDMSFINITIGSASAGPVGGFFLTVVTGILLCGLGIGAWRLLLRYIHSVSQKKRNLEV